jgi:hypothetical protein
MNEYKWYTTIENKNHSIIINRSNRSGSISDIENAKKIRRENPELKYSRIRGFRTNCVFCEIGKLYSF